MAAFGWRRPLKIGSTVMTSGSVKYVVGAPPGPKSRGGVVTVLGGAMGPPGGAWARTMAGERAAAPAATPTVFSIERRDIRLASSMTASWDHSGATVTEALGDRNRPRRPFHSRGAAGSH